MFRSLFFLWCVFTLPLAVLAKVPQYGEPIPAQAWEVESDPARGIQDAAYLEHYTQLKGAKARHYRLIRILSEEGKKAAAFAINRKIILKMRGRVIERDGTVTPFERGEDFVDITTYRWRFFKDRSRLLIPPGLSDDCIVELEWETRANSGLEKDRWAAYSFIREPYFCLRKVIDISEFHTKILPRTCIYYRPSPTLNASQVKSSNTALYLEYSEVEPYRVHPFAGDLMEPNAAYVLMFRTYFQGYEKADDLWSRYCKSSVRNYYWKFQGSSSHRAWLKTLRADLEANPATHPKKNPVAAAKHTLEALQQRISTTALLTADELEEHRDTRTRFVPNMERNFRDGRATPKAFTGIYLHTLRSLGIKEKLIFTSRDPRVPFNPAERYTGALDLYRPLVLVEQGDQSAVFCPWQSALAAGQYPSNMQGRLGLIVDPHDRWRHRFEVTPVYGPETNLSQTTYQGSLAEDGTLRFQLKKIGTGNFNKTQTQRYYSMTDEERERQLRETWQWRLGQEYQLNDVQLDGHHDANQLAVVNLSAQRRLKPSADWLPITPFPGSRIDLHSPAQWYENRTVPILLEQSFRHVDTLILKVPTDWQLRGRPRWQKTNQVGSVTFLATQDGDTVTVQRAVTLTSHILEAEKQEQLRLFLAWVEEVSIQQIGVLKGGA